MLDAYIIDAIQKEEEERQHAEDSGRRIQLEIPEIGYHHPPSHPEPENDEEQRGPIVIPLYPSEDAA